MTSQNDHEYEDPSSYKKTDELELKVNVCYM